MIKICFLYIILFLSIETKAQDCPMGQIIEGIITDVKYKNVKLYLGQTGDETILDSIICTNGEFQFCLKEVPYPIFYIRLEADNKKFFISSLVCDYNSPIKIEISNIEKGRYFVTSTLLNDKWKKYDDIFSQLYYSMNSTSYNKDPIKGKSQIEEQLYSMLEESFSHDEFIFLSVLSSRKNTIIKMELSTELITKLKFMLSKLSPKLKNTKQYQKISEYFDKALSRLIGQKMLDFSLKSCRIDSLNTKNMRGKYLIISFWASWCGPCKVKNKIFSENYEALKKENIEILHVFIDNVNKETSSDELVNLCKIADTYPWHQGLLTKNKNSQQIMDYYRVLTIPKTILVSTDGQIIAVDPQDLADMKTEIKRYENSKK